MKNRVITTPFEYNLMAVLFFSYASIFLIYIPPLITYWKGIGINTIDGYYYFSSEVIIKTSLIFFVWSLLSIATVFLINLIYIKKSKSSLIQLEELNFLFNKFYYFIFPVFIIHQLVQFSPSFEGIISAVSDCIYIALALGLMLCIRNYKKAGYYPIVKILILIISLVLMPFSLGKVAEIFRFSIVMMFILIFCKVKKQNLFASLLILILITIGFLASKNIIRENFYDGMCYQRFNVSNFDNLKYIANWKGQFKHHIPSNLVAKNSFFSKINNLSKSDPAIYSISDKMLSRINHFSLLAHVVNFSPSKIPYWGYELYKPIIFSIFPRAIYPDKPNIDHQNAFGRKYGLLAEDDLITSQNVDLISESWIAGGWTSVLACAFFYGLVVGFSLLFLNLQKSEIMKFMISVLVVLNLCFLESSFNIVICGLVHVMCVFYLILNLFRSSFWKKIA